MEALVWGGCVLVAVAVITVAGLALRWLWTFNEGDDW